MSLSGVFFQSRACPGSAGLAAWWSPCCELQRSLLLSPDAVVSALCISCIPKAFMLPSFLHLLPLPVRKRMLPAPTANVNIKLKYLQELLTLAFECRREVVIPGAGSTNILIPMPFPARE